MYLCHLPLQDEASLSCLQHWMKGVCADGTGNGQVLVFAACRAALADTTCHQWPYVRHWTQTCQDTPGRLSWATCSCQLLTALPPPMVLGEGLLVREGQWVAGAQEGGTLVEVALAWKTYLEFPVHVFVQASTNKGKNGLMVLNQSVPTKIQ